MLSLPLRPFNFQLDSGVPFARRCWLAENRGRIVSNSRILSVQIQILELFAWYSLSRHSYYGLNSQIANGGVQYILTSVVEQLRQNATRKFTFVEIAFFARWWAEQSDDTKTLVRSLVRAGQLEFTNGGASMHDEAAPTVTDWADQMTWCAVHKS